MGSYFRATADIYKIFVYECVTKNNVHYFVRVHVLLYMFIYMIPYIMVYNMLLHISIHRIYINSNDVMVI